MKGRLVDRWQRGASAWLHATRRDPRQRLQNAYFRVAVGRLLGVNCFPEVDPQSICPNCKGAVGIDPGAHGLRCKSTFTGDNNRRHNSSQQELLFWARKAGASVVITPGVTSWSGAAPVDPTHAGRMFDLGVRGLDNADFAIDLCVSDCGLGSPPASYKAGAKCEARGKAKKAKYLARFPTLDSEELLTPSHGASGSKNKDAKVLQKRIINALASADLTIPRWDIARSVNQSISVALQRAIAYNILDYRYTRLARAQVVAQLSSGGEDWDQEDDDDGGDGSTIVGEAP